jgi:hypothetical protein
MIVGLLNDHIEPASVAQITAAGVRLPEHDCGMHSAVGGSLWVPPW